MGMKVRRPAWAELSTDVVIGASEASAIALGGRELEGVALADPTEVIHFGFQHAYDAWASASGATYVCSWRSDPLFCTVDGSWQLVEVPEAHDRIVRVVGIAGASPLDDELVCVAEPYEIRTHPQATLLSRRGGQWRELALPPGKCWELAVGARDAFVSLDGDAPAIYRICDGAIEAVAPPAEAAGHRAVGLCAVGDDELVVCFSAPGSEEATAWIRRGEAWTALSSAAPLRGWATGYIDSVTWRGRVYLATNGAVWRLVGDRLEPEIALCARRLWPIGDALVSTGFRGGTYAHAIERGDGWQPLSIPAPDVVFGGRGKVAWLPPRRKVPRRRVRMKKASPAAAAPPAISADDYCARWLEARAFRDRATRRDQPLPVAEDLRLHAGVDLSPALRRYLELYGAYEPERSFGELTIWSPTDFAPPARAPSAADLASHVFYQQPSTIAALTNTVYLGADAGGQVYFAQVAPAASEVFLYDPGQGELALLADSLDAFCYLNDLAQQWADYARANDVDYEDVEAGAVDVGAPAVRAIADGIRALDGRVNLDEDGDVMSDYHELMPALAGVRPTAVSRSVVPRLFARAHWLIMALGDIYLDPALAADSDFDRDRADPDVRDLAATKVYWLWHLFAFGDDRLAAFAADVAGDSSALVRATAELVSSLATPTGAAAFPQLAGLRERVRAGG